MNQEKIGKFIAENRKKQKLTQEQLAQKLGVTDRAVSNWENGKCMPDLALFNPLCEILEITVNDLMSGEIVDNKNYVNTLGENIINIVSNLENRKKRKTKIITIILIIIPILLLIGRFFYYFYEIDVKYDERVLMCSINDNELNFKVKGQSVWNTYHTIRELNNEKIYFFHSTVSIYNKRRSNWEYSHSMARLLEGKEVTFGSFKNIELDDKKTKVYYTDNSIRVIRKADEVELKNIIKNSYLMCQN